MSARWRRSAVLAWTVSAAGAGACAGHAQVPIGGLQPAAAQNGPVSQPPATPSDADATTAPAAEAGADPPSREYVIEPDRAGTSDSEIGRASAAEGLRDEIDQLFAGPTLSTAIVSGLVESMETGEVLYRRNPDGLVVPGSNQKVVTMAVAAARLGWEYRFETRLEAMGFVRDGTLEGDLFVVGSGDPSIDARGGDLLAAFHDWADRLKSDGIRRIAGRIVGDDDAFEDARFGKEWAWDDFVYAYAAPVGALEFNDDSVEVVITPGATIGRPATARLKPSGSDLTLSEIQVTTAAAGTPEDIGLSRFPGQPALRVTGVIAIGAGETTVRAAVDNPTLYFVRVLRDVLRSDGIAVDGDAVDIDDVTDNPMLKASAGQRQVLWLHRSAPLAEIGRTMMKVSQNLYAESVFRALSALPGPSSVEGSRAVADETLRTWGLDPTQYSIADGSGLSRLNFVSATMMVRILRAMARDEALSGPFEAAFPVAGRDGTLAGRMKGTRAEGNATAKTGTLAAVRSISGYVKTRDGERLVFSFLVNNFLLPASAVDAVVDHAVERLANFKR